jgi:flavin-dependent dehydrogenase
MTSINLIHSVGLTLVTVTLISYLQKLKKDDCKIQNSDKKLKCNKDIVYDVIIVGAGPAGSTAACYLGLQGLRVALVDKKTFPRPKPCGDAWCAGALKILSELGILTQMEQDGVCHPVTRGGLISPFGYECINTEGSKYGEVTGCKTYAIKRHIADHYLVKKASSYESVALFESREVINAVYNESKAADETGFYTVEIKDSSSELKGELQATFVLICDGSTSYLGQKLGIIPKSQSQATCSHAYINDHSWHDKKESKAADGVMIFNTSVLPGYSALFRHADGSVYLGTYILPGGKATSRSIAPFENELITKHPYVSSSLGSSFSYL